MEMGLDTVDRRTFVRVYCITLSVVRSGVTLNFHSLYNDAQEYTSTAFLKELCHTLEMPVYIVHAAGAGGDREIRISIP